jgi:hypothetical protein
MPSVWLNSIRIGISLHQNRCLQLNHGSVYWNRRNLARAAKLKVRITNRLESKNSKLERRTPVRTVLPPGSKLHYTKAVDGGVPVGEADTTAALNKQLAGRPFQTTVNLTTGKEYSRSKSAIKSEVERGADVAVEGVEGVAVLAG